MIKSTRVPFQARFILRLYVGVDTLHRAFFITKYIRQNHLALEHLEFAWVRLQRGCIECVSIGVVTAAGREATACPCGAGSPGQLPQPQPRGQHPCRGGSVAPPPSTHPCCALPRPPRRVGKCVRCWHSRLLSPQAVRG